MSLKNTESEVSTQEITDHPHPEKIVFFLSTLWGLMPWKYIDRLYIYYTDDTIAVEKQIEDEKELVNVGVPSHTEQRLFCKTVTPEGVPVVYGRDFWDAGLKEALLPLCDKTILDQAIQKTYDTAYVLSGKKTVSIVVTTSEKVKKEILEWVANRIKKAIQENEDFFRTEGEIVIDTLCVTKDKGEGIMNLWEIMALQEDGTENLDELTKVHGMFRIMLSTNASPSRKKQIEKENEMARILMRYIET